MQVAARISVSGPLLAGKPQAVVRQHVERFVTSATLYLWREVKLRTPQGVYGAQGGLLASIQQEVRGKGTPIVRGIVATASPYGETIERGRRPGRGMPPPGVLLRWIEIKFGLDEAAAKRIEFVVRRKIGQRGFDGVHMFERALDENYLRLMQMAQAEGLLMSRELN